MSYIFKDIPFITIKELLRQATEHLKSSSESPRLDAEILLCLCFNREKTWLYTNLDTYVPKEILDNFRLLLKRRLNKEPIAHIVGYKEFWKDKFLINKHTLIPRPETELIVEQSLLWCNKHKIKEPKILDLGTGTGNIALSILREIEDAKAFCLDISLEAIKLARINAKRLKVEDRAYFFVSDWFNAIKKQPFFDVIVTNPPYISSEELNLVDQTVKEFEPQSALLAEENGLSEIKNILHALPFYVKSPMLFISEIGFKQKKDIIAILDTLRTREEIKFQYQILKDLAGLDRAVKLEFA